MERRRCYLVKKEIPAWFHGWGKDIIFNADNSPKEYTIAVVEDDKGKILTALPGEIEFIDRD